ncbi:hypothetical protein IE53DRAFT_383189 [Violaceomyces palustris]|uniref:Uncharacterized protein n=1 Tax=Violaceomyces palustris TaxID=1673888 RepID=A0ACD0P7Y7_9BASI|nr:hypothetical protein IE53DRAFT_383189 [Violaceomyces palustris]
MPGHYDHAAAGHLPPNQRIHDGLPPGPHRLAGNQPAMPPLFLDTRLRGLDDLRARLLAFRNPIRPNLGAAAATVIGARTGPGGGQADETNVPKEYDAKWTHPNPARKGFTHNIIEPPVDLETYFDDKAKVTGPLPNTTPICAGCRHALVLGGSGHKRLWALPCGHLIDGRCVSKLSGKVVEPASSSTETHADEEAQVEAVSSTAHGDKARAKGKRKAVELPEGQPLRKSPRGNKGKGRALESSSGSTPKPKKFKCPVPGCGQQCFPEPGHKISCFELYI